MRIYKITNTINGKIYVGQTVMTLSKRFGCHVRSSKRTNSSTAIHNAIRKYGSEAFSIELIKECSSVDQLNDAERYWIDRLNTLAPNGYNIELGGSHFPMADATKQKLRDAGKDRKNKNPEWYAKVCNAARNRQPEWRENISKARMGNKPNENQLRALAAGRVLTKPVGYSAGEKNGRAKLNLEQVAEIRRLYAAGNHSQQRLGDIFGVHQTCIGFIVRSESWA